MLYFPYVGKAPAGPILPKSCMVGNVHDVITCAKFRIEIIMGYKTYNFTVGRIFDFPIDFCHGPYNSAALMRCLWWTDCIALFVSHYTVWNMLFQPI